jgi:nitrate reductase (NAD(P)H)
MSSNVFQRVSLLPNHTLEVYDVTKYLESHPGGADSITMNGGEDCTVEFEAIHSKNAWKLLAKYQIGEVGDPAAAAAAAAAAQDEGPAPVQVKPAAAVASTSLTALSKKEKRSFKLAEKEELSPDVCRFRFALQSPEHELGLPTGKHMFIYAEVDGETVMRAYTPTSNNNQRGYFDLVIKIYVAHVHPRFPDGGKMSQHFHSMKIGDAIQAKGPVGHIEYVGRSAFKLGKAELQLDEVGFICGGTGITPAYQIMQTALRDDEDKTVFSLILANNRAEDILLRDELDEWALKYPTRVKVWYTLSEAPEGWKYSTGYVSEDMCRDHLPAASARSNVFMCGPPPMIKFACVPNLEKMGYAADQLHTF